MSEIDEASERHAKQEAKIKALTDMLREIEWAKGIAGACPVCCGHRIHVEDCPLAALLEDK